MDLPVTRGCFRIVFVPVLLAGLAQTLGCSSTAESAQLSTPRLLVTLPRYCPTPDGMALDAEGNIIVACPNFADQTQPAVLMKIDKQNRASLWVKVPPHPETKVACPMGIAFGPDGDLYVCDNQGWVKPNDKGRILRLRIKGGEVVKTTVVADGMAHPNGVRVHEGHLYVTQSMLPKIKHEDGKLASAVYRFELDDENVQVQNTSEDKNLLVLLKTLNADCQYGADGLVFDSKGNLYVGNFGDGAIHRIAFDVDGNIVGSDLFAHEPEQMRTTDGICVDEHDNIFVADFSDNAVAMVTPGGKVKRLARSPDCDGSAGGLDQPGEPILRGRELIVTNFDTVTGPDKVNSKNDYPYTLSVILLDE